MPGGLQGRDAGGGEGGGCGVHERRPQRWPHGRGPRRGVALEPPAPPAAPLPTAPDWAAEPDRAATGAAVPHVIAWNLTRRCNLACAHCYISAGPWHASADELPTADCLRIVDEILAVNPGVMLILSGGEPLLRDDLETIAARAAAGGATVVVGTNGTRLTEARIRSLQGAGVRGVAISVDSLEATYHDRFRHGEGALADTLAAVDRLGAHGLDFIVQTTVTRGNRRELPTLAAWAADRGAVSFNVYFLVSTGRGADMSGLSPAENEAVLADLVALERTYRGRMLVRSKCQPQIMRHVYHADSDSPLLNYATRCPCGVQYCRITPDGKVTPCPYLPAEAGDLTTASFGSIWRDAQLFAELRGVAGGEVALGGKCGRCGYRVVCGGCRARAYAESGDVLGADESCVYEPDGQETALRPARAVTYGAPAAPTLTWSPEAEARMSRAPSFVRGVVMARVEAFATERGYPQVTADVLDEVRRAMPVDFSSKLPNFLKRGA